MGDHKKLELARVKKLGESVIDGIEETPKLSDKEAQRQKAR